MPKEAPPKRYQGLPVLTSAAMRELDQMASERCGVPVSVLMENAGRAVAKETLRYLKEALGKDPNESRVVVCCGRGANGGDGLVAARLLKEAGARVAVVICPPKRDAGVSADYPPHVKENLERARAAGVKIASAGPEAGLEADLAACDVALDALLGTGSSGKPAGAIHHMIQALTRSKKPVLALDLPSGVHPDTGYHSGVFVTAALTLTLGFPKRGLLAPHAAKHVGELRVLDIGYPKEVSARADALAEAGT